MADQTCPQCGGEVPMLVFVVDPIAHTDHEALCRCCHDTAMREGYGLRNALGTA